MNLSKETEIILQKLDTLSKNKIGDRASVGVLIELAATQNVHQTLDDLSFQAKFSYRAYGIMKRIGKEGDGYNKLSKEFNESVEKSKNLIRELLLSATDDERKEFDSRFLALSPAAFQNLLALLYDLSWYKNFLIDSRSD